VRSINIKRERMINGWKELRNVPSLLRDYIPSQL